MSDDSLTQTESFSDGCTTWPDPMRALICDRVGDVPTLDLRLVDDPKPSPTQVVVAVEAAGVNFADTLIVRGRYQVSPPTPFSPGGEAAGIIAEVGDSVHGLEIGQRVIALGPFGAFAEKWTVESTSVVPMPDELDSLTAAAFGLTYGTSYYALKDRAALRRGETLLVLGASGGVGTAAVELGKALGATVIAGASSERKLEWARELGADHVIDYSRADIRDELDSITDGLGVDVVYDAVGGELSELALRSTSWNGRFLVIGFASGEIPAIRTNLTLVKGVSIIGVHWGRSLAVESALHRANFEELAELLGTGRIRPRVTEVHDLTDYEAAFASLRDRRALGKVVLTLS